MGRPMEAGMTGERKQRMVNDDVVDFGSAWSSDKVNGLFERRNILHNWDFTNPVNQRGQSSYSEPGAYTVDRWRSRSAAASIELFPGHLSIKGNMSNMPGITQILEQDVANAITGRSATLSALLKDGTIHSGSGYVGTALNVTYFWIPLHPEGGTTRARMTLFRNSTGWLSVHIISNDDGSPLEIRRVKLELGTVSTLANDPPMDYGRELAVCQRYQLVFPEHVSVPLAMHTPNGLSFLVPTPVTMRISPAFLPHMLNVSVSNFVPAQNGFMFQLRGVRPNGVSVDANLNGHGLQNAFLVVHSGTVFDANL